MSTDRNEAQIRIFFTIIPPKLFYYILSKIAENIYNKNNFGGFMKIICTDASCLYCKYGECTLISILEIGDLSNKKCVYYKKLLNS